MRTIIHVAVGNENWNPMTSELETIKQLFEEATANDAVVVTRDGVQSTVLHILEEGDSVEVNVTNVHNYGGPEKSNDEPDLLG